MITAVGVVIPAYNERALIGPCLAALAAAREHAHGAVGPDLDVRILVVLDSCTDGMEREIPADLGIDTVTCRYRRVGGARALGARMAIRDSAHPPRHTWLANTDADSRVPAHWLTHMIESGNDGAHLTLGTVRPDLARATADYRRWRRLYTPHDGHPHIHGANLGVRADTYLELGGWPELSHDEDVELVRRARAVPGLRIVRTGAIPVATSARREGRAPAGFAKHMRSLTDLSTGDSRRVRGHRPSATLAGNTGGGVAVSPMQSGLAE